MPTPSIAPEPLAYAVDVSEFPLVRVHATPAIRDDAALERTYRALDALLARRREYGAILDLHNAYSDAARRQRFVTWMRQNRPRIAQYCVGQAVVARSAVERGLVTAVLWAFRPATPVEVFATEADARSWLTQRLGEAGATLCGE